MELLKQKRKPGGKNADGKQKIFVTGISLFLQLRTNKIQALF